MSDRGGDVAVRWFPPAWIVISSPAVTVHIDPAYLKTYFARHPSRIEYSTWPDPIDGLPEPMSPADLVLITHAHKDHCKQVTVARVSGPHTTVMAPEACRRELGDGFQVVAPGDVLETAGVSIRAVPAHNTPTGRSTRKQHPPGRDVGYVVEIDGLVVYHAGDTDLIEAMGELGRVDVACLPIGGTFTMAVDEAVSAATIISPRWVVPMHRLRVHVDEFVAALERAATPARPALLGIGDTLEP